MTNNTTPISVRAVPVDLWRQIKAKAATDGLTIAEVVTKALEQYVAAA